MAKTDSFFIRQELNIGNTNTFAETTIDLGSFVDALGKAVLRIHNLSVKYSDADGATADVNANSNASAQFQLTTQSQTDLVTLDERSLISSGHMIAFNDTAIVGVPSVTSDSFDASPQAFTNGYLVAVEQMYLGGRASTGFGQDCFVSVMLECTVESLSEKAAVALALSQQ
jgi:hypothetical protein